jgi:hypothetical protein
VKTVINIATASFAAIESLKEGCWVELENMAQSYS